MALDAETIGALTEELDRKLRDGRIEKVQQPEKDLLLLTVRTLGENRKVLIRAAGPNARMHLTEQSFENPKEAPMFCMLLRKHLTGARILGVTQPGGDRLMVFSLEGRNELGDRSSLRLVTELLGRAANVILIDGEDRILDCLKRIPPTEHGGRALLPGLRYELPVQPEGFRQKPVKDLPGEKQSEFSPSETLDARFSTLERQELQRRRAQELVKSVRRSRDRQQRKLAVQMEELRRSENMDAVRQKAELPLKTPQQNLAAGFKEYRKLKGAREHLTVLTEEGGKQLDYLNSVLEELSRAENERDLGEIRAELEITGFLSSRGKAAKNARKTAAKRQKQTSLRMAEPLRFETPDGLEVLVGRNNLQNDLLTTEIARRTDYWLHVKDLHGSHVILRCEGLKPSDAALEFAAQLAARYSQAADSGKVAVDYAMVRDVKKPSGSLPGKVIYTNYRTIVVKA